MGKATLKRWMPFYIPMGLTIGHLYTDQVVHRTAAMALAAFVGFVTSVALQVAAEDRAYRKR